MKLYFMGICGTAMGHAALLARAAGHEVAGADAGAYPPMSTVLATAGVAIHEGYDAARLARLRPDLVIIGNALSRGNAEVEWLLDTRAVACTSLPAWLAEFVLRGRTNVVVAGTHGKTTTTALAAFLLRANGGDPGYLVGGVPRDLPAGQHLGGATEPFVIEGDEYDSAFFDKRSKFIHYAPRIAVLNNLEFDHADIFRDLADVQRSFRHFTRIVPRSGWVVLNGDDANLAALGPLPWTQVVRVGEGAGNDLRIVEFAETGAGAEFALLWRGAPWARVRWGLAGRFNARNAAMAALAAGLARSPAEPTRLRLEALADFRGVRRRQELLLDTPRLKVIEDFGHHPTAVGETLAALRARFPEHVLHAAFEPRSNTSRTKVLQAAFMRALARADEVYLGVVARADKLPPDERFDTEAVIEHLATQGVDGHTAPDHAALLEVLRRRTAAEPGRPQVVVFFTNGSFDGIIGQFVRGAQG